MKRAYSRDKRSPVPKNEILSRTMSAIRAKNTGPEKVVRSLFQENKIKGFKTHQKNIPGRPDFAFSKQKVAVFVHGCFWHGCRYCKLKLPKHNHTFWRNKIETNRVRDGRKNRELIKLGWYPVTIWACRLKTERGRRRSLNRILTAIQ